MNKKIYPMVGILITMLSACSRQAAQPITDTESMPVDSEVIVEKLPKNNEIQISELTKLKMGRELKLTRMMEGGVCKNDEQGVVGAFKLYTNPEDVERIKQKQGPEIFADFESLISGFSMRSLQEVINRLDFSVKSEEQNEDKIKKQLAEELTALFIELIADDIAKFERETTLMIDVIPDSESLVIYLSDCETPHDH